MDSTEDLKRLHRKLASIYRLYRGYSPPPDRDIDRLWSAIELLELELGIIK